MGDRRLEEAGDEVIKAFFPRSSSEMKATRSTSIVLTLAKGHHKSAPQISITGYSSPNVHDQS